VPPPPIGSPSKRLPLECFSNIGERFGLILVSNVELRVMDPTVMIMAEIARNSIKKIAFFKESPPFIFSTKII
jgi:hypothetical protein